MTSPSVVRAHCSSALRRSGESTHRSGIGGRRHEYRVGPRLCERGDVDPFAVDGHGNDLDARLPSGHDGVAKGGVLDREARPAAREEGGADHVKSLREALDHDQAPRASDDTARPAEPLRQRLAHVSLP